MTNKEYKEYLDAAKEFSHNLLALDESYNKLRALDPSLNDWLKEFNRAFRKLVNLSGYMTKKLQSHMWNVKG